MIFFKCLLRRGREILESVMGVLWEKSAFGVLATLIGSGVIGLWSLSVNVGRLEERVATWTTLYEKRFDGMERKFERYDAEQVKIRDEVLRHQNLKRRTLS